MLKLAAELEEKRGAALMVWWEDEGAARVLAHGTGHQRAIQPTRMK